MQMTLKRKLFLGFCSILILLTILVSISVIILYEQNKNMNEIVLIHYEKIYLATTIEKERALTSKSVKDILLDPSTLSPKEIDLIDKSRLRATIALVKLFHIEDGDPKWEKVIDLQVINQAFEQDVKELLSLLQAGKREAALQLYNTPEHGKNRQDLQDRSFELQDDERVEMDALLKYSQETYTRAIQLLLFLFTLSLLVGIVVSRRVVNGFSLSINRVSDVISSVGKGNMVYLPRIEVISKDEIGEISKAFNQMAITIEQKAQIEEEFNQTLQDQKWVETQLTGILTLLQGVTDLETLSKLFITTITPVLNASYGVFYSVKGNEGHKYISPLASYAYQHDEQLKIQDFHLGEGLVGQCVLDGRETLLNDVPDDYIKVHSGLGNTSPKNIYIMPIKFEGGVLAVVEFASLTPFTLIQMTLLDRTLETIGILHHSVTRQMQVKILLEQSQSLTEELQSQSEELQMQHEEMRSINEQLEKQYQDLERKTQELEKTKLELEEKAQQLFISSQFKSEFLANMSHELRTPLNSMLILAQMFAENKDENLTEKQMEYAHSIYSGGKDLLNLINEILDLAKAESGKLDINHVEVDTDSLLRDIERQFSPVSEMKKLYFKIHLDPDFPKLLITDELRLMQILKNLLSNAFKFTEKGGVELRFSRLSEMDFLEGHVANTLSLAISVVDTGIGIARDKQELIFEAFRQADGTISRKHGGTGLGLSISRELAQLLGGTIELLSVEGQGSTFTLYLPNKPNYLSKPIFENQKPNLEVIPQAVPLPPQKQASLEGKKILIVDDDMRNVFSLTTLLEKQNMKVLFAENGQESIETLKANPDIDIILMDIMMPEMDGYAAIRAIRKIKDFKTLPIIALTAKAMKNDREKCIEAGASDYITKPVNIDQLHSLLHVWLYRLEG